MAKEKTVAKASPPATTQEEDVVSILSKIKSIVAGNDAVDIDNDDKVSDEKVSNEPQPVEEEDFLELTEVVEAEGDIDPSELDELLVATEKAEISIDEIENIDELIMEAKAELEVVDGSDNLAGANIADDDEFVDILKQIDDSIDQSDAKLNDKVDIAKKIEDNKPTVEEVVEEKVFVPTPIAKPVEKVAEPVFAAVEVEEKVVEKERERNLMSEQVSEKLISEEKAAISSMAIKSLMNNIPKPKIESQQFRSGNTVEDLVLESLKPMLKDWLDNNLEIIVRDIVEKEIRKLVPRE